MRTTVIRVCLLAGCACVLAACGRIEPWVLPYEREALADPLMSLSRDPLSDKHREHVFDVREAARGGGRAAGGGCGCN